MTTDIVNEGDFERFCNSVHSMLGNPKTPDVSARYALAMRQIAASIDKIYPGFGSMGDTLQIDAEKGTGKVCFVGFCSPSYGGIVSVHDMDLIHPDLWLIPNFEKRYATTVCVRETVKEGHWNVKLLEVNVGNTQSRPYVLAENVRENAVALLPVSLGAYSTYETDDYSEPSRKRTVAEIPEEFDTSIYPGLLPVVMRLNTAKIMTMGKVVYVDHSPVSVVDLDSQVGVPSQSEDAVV